MKREIFHILLSIENLPPPFSLANFTRGFGCWNNPEPRRDSNMRTKLVVPSLVLLAGMLAPGAVYAEEYRGTWEQQMACTPDVWRLCGDQIPDVNRIVACLQRNTPNLSGSCRAVFESSNSLPQSQGVAPPRARAVPAPNGRMAPPPRPGDDDDE
jgi:hypothetical protein